MFHFTFISFGNFISLIDYLSSFLINLMISQIHFTIEAKVERLFCSELNKKWSEISLLLKFLLYCENWSRLFCIRSLVFYVFHRSVFLSTFLCSLSSSSLYLLYPLVDASQTLTGIFQYIYIYFFLLFRSFLHTSLPSCQASSKLLLSFWWRDSALCHACLELPLCPLFFPSCLGLR